MELRRRVAVVYGTPPGIGGLGHSVSAGISAVANGSSPTFALGPKVTIPWSLPGGLPSAIWSEAPVGISPWKLRYTWLRWQMGHAHLLRVRAFDKWAGEI